MQKEIRELYPKFINEIDEKKFVSGFTADMDGLLCASFAKHHLGLEVNSFYDFKGLYVVDNSEERETVFFDCALKEGKCFDNHITKFGVDSLLNPESANINSVMDVHRGRYRDKFAMSTLIQLYALYNVPLPKTLQGKLTVLCCDVGFKGFYDNRFRDQFLSYLQYFDMVELVEVLEQFTQDQMYEFMLRAQMNMSIQVQNNKHLYIDMASKNSYGAKWHNFETGMDLDFFSKHLEYPVELPASKFELVEKFRTVTLQASQLSNEIIENAHSYAFINSQKVMVSLKTRGR
ncbi:hypothetical protein NCCP2331_02500 [Sporosarcina sp. NCCP-2331]|nr:hypothetical protein NCCP2331_02500 [Sporosarcina sp. NCCP-2331]GLB54438.1 hypothetical protein NCCP2378_02230 [Sporosarcina sp. NCCP-2378]